MAQDNSSNTVAIIAILVIVVFAGVIGYYLFTQNQSGKDTTIVQPVTKVVTPSSN